jgi:16S rRNA (guanine527-N7)-methyltransferase
MSEFGVLLRKVVSGFMSLSDDQVALMEAHYDLLQHWNRRLNLTAIRGLAQAVFRHYAESLFLASLVRQFGASCSAVDIGSGAGFPGLPLAIVLPEWRVTLVECHQRKAVFLRESSRNLSNVAVMAERFEAITGTFDVAVSRAVAWRDFSGLVSKRTQHIALLVGRTDIESIRNTDRFTWNQPLSPPWDENTVVVLGST